MIERFPLSRRSFLAAAGATTLSGTIAAPALAQTANKPLKIGMVTSLSGPFTALGESMRAGMQMFLAENGGKLAGRAVELIVEDDQAKPDEGVRKFRKLLGQDNVDIVSGVISSAVALAVRDVVTEAKALTFISAGSANDLARKAASPFVFRPTKTNWMLGHTAGQWAFEKLGKSGCLTIAADYAAGRESVGDFVASYQQQGGKVGKQLWAPLGTTDFGPLLTTIAAEKPEFIFSFFAGSDAVRFLRQMRDYRLHGKVKLIGSGALFDQEDVVSAVKEAALGGLNTCNQSPTAPSSAAFTKAYQAARNAMPGEMGTAGYVTGQVIKAAVERVQGDLSNKEKVKEALLAKEVETVFGPMPFDPRNNQAILDIYVNEVKEGAGGVPVNQVIHTYKGVRDPGPVA
ncbi:MAG TPA: ABC transporter substrate-binding protein [Bosea sp. (in: a-proteobacteria)]|jgi:branched-chain amino acid transport system substrate-binding protein|uniref:ABC transporter substrate-binding protein n=1 Tax=Bosea sp. (in: a-proteobacteria) TaxID=1871050 RepID=UPI002E0FB67D|nr:ABC transporter substrate-binding protein [Bosea sp. (in: a-proteobacteria)]